MDFKFKIYAPTINEYIRFREFNNEQFLNITKSILNDDNDQLYELYMNLVCELSDDDNLVNRVSRVDMFCILLNLYILCVSSELQIQDPNSGPVGKTVIKLYDILDMVTNYETKYSTRIDVSDDISIVVSPPHSLYLSDPDAIIFDCVSRIKILNNWFDLSELNDTEKQHVIDDLPGEVINSIVKNMYSVNDEYRLNVVKLGPEPDQSIILTMYNNSMFELLKIIYRSSLDNEYFMRYFMAKHLNVTITEFNQMPPAEARAYLKLFQREQEEQKKEQEKQSKNKTGMHLGSPVG